MSRMFRPLRVTLTWSKTMAGVLSCSKCLLQSAQIGAHGLFVPVEGMVEMFRPIGRRVERNAGNAGLGGKGAPGPCGILGFRYHGGHIFRADEAHKVEHGAGRRFVPVVRL